MDLDYDLLFDLMRAPGASSFESAPAAVWRDAARDAELDVRRDAYGSVVGATGREDGPRLLLAGHIDEIGLLVTHVDDKGYAWVKPIGGWDPEQLVGQAVRVVGRAGEAAGVLGKKPIHLMKAEDRRKPSRVEDLWIDVGARDRDDAREVVAPGDFAVIERAPMRLRNGRITGKAVDDRVGAFVALEVARRSRDAPAHVLAAATVQEEITGLGAATAAFGAEPDAAIAIDVTHATDVPGVDEKREGAHALGSGPELSVGSYVHRGRFELLRETAEDEGIDYTVAASPRRTATDADDLARVRSGVPTAVVSIPNRYMHSPNETIDPSDVEATVRLLLAFTHRWAERHPVAQP